MKFKILLLSLIGLLNLQAQTAKKAADTDGIFATIATNKGDIVLQLDYQKAPVTVANFVSLAEGKNPYVSKGNLKGTPFFDGLKFHRVISDFMIQGGDPLGNGSGDPGYSFKDEFNDDLKFDAGGVLAMANSGPKTNGSQFFITHKETPWLNNKHTIFGHVIQGMDVVNKILMDDVITKVTIVKKGSTAKKFDAAKVFIAYYENKAEDEKKEALLAEEKKKQIAALALEKEKEHQIKYAPVSAAKKAYFDENKKSATTTATGLTYKIVTKGTAGKPVAGETLYFHYAGYFEDGTLFDSSMENVATANGKHDVNRAAQGGYNAFPFPVGKKDGMIPGFTEGLALMNYGDKGIFYIPAPLGYGERGAGDVIPPNATLIFEIEITKEQPGSKK
ncbi:peptidylprolyl isomerase [Flavobacterium sp. TAB 87]|uniref:peptidylprolyl isomerase n=1 Tax=Flavobacterium sp. TAB 87 TaxID=1729581 RepID=UPI00076D8ECF|nr:peptidylprolyl isomerase [Flavobacterium sp. TAB 87]KVV14026.1 putative peptidyl-prolyl cis-trans isomerase [Flavobacterium sp. TAB 87]